MSVTQQPTASPPPCEVAVLLPGTASDDVFVRAVFEVPLAAVGVRVVAPKPVPGREVVRAARAVLDRAAAKGPVLVGGISLGAHLAAQWALANPDRCTGLLLALPGWTGPPDGAPAALASRLAATSVREHGVEGALALATEGVRPWIAEELSRSWRGYGDGLADTFAASVHPAPTSAELAGLDVPAGVAGCADDPIHPIEVARAWAGALPRAALATTRLAIMGIDREALGRAAVLAWLRAGGRRA